ncbi:MAG: hypothetical protein EOM10_14170 [Opitutae bacterium]|nr:hypothetical protein [Opitutae bacterium]
MRFCVYTTMLGVLGACFAAGAGNLVANPSFEEGANGAPVGWVRYRMEPERLFYGERAAREGRFCIGIGDKEDKLGAGWMTEEYIRVEPGKTYRLSGWIKAENAWGGNAVCASLFTLRNGRPLWLKTEYSPSVDGAKPWTRVECEFTVPENVGFAKIGAIRRHAGSGAAYFDALALETDSPGDAAPEVVLPRPDWSRAVAAEKLHPGKLLREQAIPAAGWTKLESPGGELGAAGGVLSIADTALPGVGWLSPPFPAEPGRIYALAATVSTRNAWHVRLAVIQYGDDGRIVEIRQGGELSGDRVAATLFCRPAKGAKELRFALIQSRSGGRSEFEKIKFRCFGETGE